MAAIRLTGFAGEQPKIIARLLPPNYAQAAVNVRLDDGGLTPVRKSALVAALPDANRSTVYRHGSDWLSWPGHVDAVPGPVAADRLYFTGDGVPKMRVDGDTYPLAVGAPAAALAVAIGGVGAGDVVTRIYAYTHVTSFGEESAPSPASDPIDWKPGNSVTLSSFGVVPGGREITKQRIYRSQTGQTGTYFYLIAERAASTGDFIDTVAVDAFAEPLPSADWDAPPDGLKGITGLPNGMMAAFVDKTVYFCEPFRPHAWPEKYTMTTDYPIVGLGSVGTSLIVLTTGQPYLMQGQSPTAIQSTKLEENYPCINARGIVDMGYAVAFPTEEGLAAVFSDGRVVLVSGQLFSRYEWAELSPATMLGGQYAGQYVAFYNSVDPEGEDLSGALFINIGENPFLKRASGSAQAVYYDIEGASLHFVPTGSSAVMRYDAPGGAREEVYWKSKEFWFNAPLNFGAYRIDGTGILTPTEQANLMAAIAAAIEANEDIIAAGGLIGAINQFGFNEIPMGGDNLLQVPSVEGTVQVGIWADGKLVASLSAVGVAGRLPSGFTAEKWEIDVTATASITSIVVAQTMDELRTVPA